MRSLFASAILAAISSAMEQGPLYAYCVVSDPQEASGVTGLIKLEQLPNQEMKIEAKIAGLNADQDHAFHIHALGFTGDDCTTSAGHFNPESVNHGFYGADDPIVNRHFGDMKVLEADADGVAVYEWTDPLASLRGDAAESVFGRAMTVHRDEDDFGVGMPIEGSQKGGNAGPRLACCNIMETDRKTLASLNFDDFIDSDSESSDDE